MPNVIELLPHTLTCAAAHSQWFDPATRSEEESDDGDDSSEEEEGEEGEASREGGVASTSVGGGSTHGSLNGGRQPTRMYIRRARKVKGAVASAADTVSTAAAAGTQLLADGTKALADGVADGTKLMVRNPSPFIAPSIIFSRLPSPSLAFARLLSGAHPAQGLQGKTTGRTSAAALLLLLLLLASARF